MKVEYEGERDVPDTGRGRVLEMVVGDMSEYTKVDFPQLVQERVRSTNFRKYLINQAKVLFDLMLLGAAASCCQEDSADAVS